MQTTAFVVSLIAIVLAIGSFILAIRTDRRQHRAEQRADRQEERAEAEAAARRSAKPVVIPRGGSGGPAAARVQHEYEVRNAGPATMAELYLWIEDADGKVVSTRAGGAVGLGPNMNAFLVVDVLQPLPDEQTLMVRWTDAEGEHTESTGIPPPRHM